MSISWLFELLMLVVLGVVAPLPIGVPPLPEDPRLVRVAPADSLLFVEWFGTADPNSAATNRTERLAGERDVRDLMTGLLGATRGAIAQQMRHDPDPAVEVFDLAIEALTRPGCFHLSAVGPDPSQLALGLCVNFGDGAKAAGARVDAQLARLGAGARMEIEGVNFSAHDMPGVKLLSAVIDDYVVVTVGEATASHAVRALRKDAQGLDGHAGFAALRESTRVERPSTRTFVDVARVVAQLGTQVPAAKPILHQSGIDGVTGLLAESGLEGDGFVNRTMIAIPDAPRGLPGLTGGAPLTPADLAIVPHDASIATVLRVAPRQVFAWLLELVDAIEPGARQTFEDELARGPEQLAGLDLETDLLAHLGDCVALWNSPGQGGLLVTGLTLAVSLGDAPAFDASLATLMTALTEVAPRKEPDAGGRIPRDVYLGHREYRGRTIWFLNPLDEDLPFAPAWCTTETHLLIGLFPQSLMSTIDRGLDPGTSLVRRPEVVQHRGAVGITVLDGERFVQTLYPVLQVVGTLALGAAQREGFDLDISALPHAGTLLPHLRTEVSTLQRREDGLLLTRTGTIPWFDPIAGFGTPLIGLMPILVFRARAAETVHAAAARDEAVRAAMEAQRAAEELRRLGEKKEGERQEAPGGSGR